MVFKNYPSERLRMPSIFSRLTPAERNLRALIMEWIVASDSPVTRRFPRSAPEFLNPDVDVTVESLVVKRAIVVNANGEIVCAYPVSALPTNHRVTSSEGSSFFAMCAVDALGAAFTFGQDVMIDSCCSHCRAPVHVVIQNGRLAEFTPPDLHVLHVDLKKSENWAGSC